MSEKIEELAFKKLGTIWANNLHADGVSELEAWLIEHQNVTSDEADLIADAVLKRWVDVYTT